MLSHHTLFGASEGAPYVPVTLLVLFALLAATACRRSETPAPQSAVTQAAEWSVSLQPVTLAAAPGSAMPQLTTSQQGVIASWVDQNGPTAALRFSELVSGSWSTPQTVASGDNWFLSWADVPTVLRLSNGTLAAAWFVATRAEIEAYDVHLSHSSDNGKTWARPFTPHHDRTTTQHGFASLFELPGEGLGLVWLDGRDNELNTTDPEGGAMALRFASFDRSWKQTADQEINARVCECCQTSAVITSNGVLAAFRDRSKDEIRDIAVSRLTGGAWSEAQVVHADKWEIFSCPVNGPALSAHGDTVAAAWFTAKEGDGHAFAAFSSDAGRTWSSPVRLDDATSLGHVDVELLDDGSAVATWVEFANQASRFKMRRVTAGGGRSAAVDVIGPGEGRISGYPRLARHGETLVFAWTESTTTPEGNDSRQQVKGAVARLPRTTAP